MIIKVLILLFILMFLLSEVIEVYNGTRKKNYYQTYKYLGSTAYLIIIQLVYVKFYEKKILDDAYKTEYSWLTKNSDMLNEVLEKGKKNLIEEKLAALELFKKYKDNNFLLEGMSKRKKIEKNIDLYGDLRKLYQTEEENNVWNRE